MIMRSPLLEQTLVLLKPDAVQRGFVGEIISRLERRGIRIAASKFILVDKALAEKHYSAHNGKPFYAGLVKYICSSPILAMVWEGENCVAAVRQTMGATNPLEALPGTIRHDLALITSRNLTHASDSPESAKQEIALWFTPDEVISWDRDGESWITGKN
jgi:nucleoside-diphosphate kinase